MEGGTVSENVAVPHIPTAAERENTLAQGDFLKLSGDGIFATLQGEGVSAGEPSVFVRLQNCNLHCGANGEGWRCDAWYTWDKTTPEYWQETTNTPIDQTADIIRAAWDQKFADSSAQPRLVVTGGEPLLQQQKIIELVNLLPKWAVEIETNGTVIPHEGLRKAQMNCSPKLASSGNSLRARYRPRALQAIADFDNHWFKFVVADETTDLGEINKIVAEINIDPKRVLLMSEGTTQDKLRESDTRLANVAQRLGYATTARNHIYWFGDKRAT